MPDDQTPDTVEEFIPEGSVAIETVFYSEDFVPELPEILTFRDLPKDAEVDDQEVAEEPAVSAPVRKAPVIPAEPVQTAESEKE